MICSVNTLFLNNIKDFSIELFCFASTKITLIFTDFVVVVSKLSNIATGLKRLSFYGMETLQSPYYIVDPCGPDSSVPQLPSSAWDASFPPTCANH